MKYFETMLAGVALLLAPSAFAGPFGVTMGQSVTTLAGRPSLAKGVYKVTVPLPNAEFESYSAVALPSTGVCKIWGVGINHGNDRYGTEVQGAYRRIRELLDTKYGQSEEISYLKNGALWKGSNEWVMALRQKERTVVAYWISSEKLKLPDGIVSISLEIEALSADTAYLDLTYEFENFRTCKASFQKSASDGL